jgi:hypothetical protein
VTHANADFIGVSFIFADRSAIVYNVLGHTVAPFLFSFFFLLISFPPISLPFRSFRGRGRIIAPARYFMKLIVSAFADTRPGACTVVALKRRDEAKKKKVTASASAGFA